MIEEPLSGWASGWKMWALTRDGLLRSPTPHVAHAAAWTTREYRAVCPYGEQQPVTNPGCSCGVYVMASLEAANEWTSRSIYRERSAVLGQVEIIGRQATDPGQDVPVVRAAAVRLTTPMYLRPSLARHAPALASVYGLPFTPPPEAVWVWTMPTWQQDLRWGAEAFGFANPAQLAANLATVLGRRAV